MAAFLTRHALERALEMGVSRADVEATLADPELTYPQSATLYGRERRVHVRAGIGVVADARDGAVVTILYADATTQRRHTVPCPACGEPYACGDPQSVVVTLTYADEAAHALVRDGRTGLLLHECVRPCADCVDASRSLRRTTGDPTATAQCVRHNGGT